MAKSKRKKKAPEVQREDVTPERSAKNEFASAGMARKVVEPIATMHQLWLADCMDGIALEKRRGLTPKQFAALGRYADVASAANRSEIKCNIDFSVPGGGAGLPHFGVRMRSELEWLEHSLGPLRDIAYAVCVDLKSVSQWAMERGGAKERRRGDVAWFEPRRKIYEAAKEDIRSAGNRLARALGY